MAAWSFWTEEAEHKAGVPAGEPAWVTEMDPGAVEAEEQMTSQDSNRSEAIEELSYKESVGSRGGPGPIHD